MAEGLRFISVCAFCDTVLDVIPVPDSGPWREAECWAFLAAANHRPECKGRGVTSDRGEGDTHDTPEGDTSVIQNKTTMNETTN